MDFEDDDLSKDIAAAIDNVGMPGEAPAAPAAPEPDKTEAKATKAEKTDGERARDETGKFVKQDAAPADEKALKEAPQAQASQPGATQPKTVDVNAPSIAPPQNWKGAAKLEWSKLPANIQQQISDDYANDVAKTQAELQQFKAAVDDNRAQVLAANYGSVSQGLQNLFALSDFAGKNPQGFLLWFAQQRGIDLSQLAPGAGQQGQQGQAADASHPLMQRIAQLETQLNSFAQAQTQSQTSVLQSEIDRFAADPAHPYFNDVRPEMAALMNSGSAKTLSEAYDAAVWAKPNVRSALLEAERQKALSANQATVQKATKAAVSITGSPAGGKPPPDAESDDDLEATVRKNVERVLAA